MRGWIDLRNRRDEAVPGPVHGPDQARMVSVVAERAPQYRDDAVEHRWRDVAVAPYRVE